jgi:hypothetical protein
MKGWFCMQSVSKKTLMKQEAKQMYRLTKLIEVSITFWVDHPSQALGLDDLVQIRITDKQGAPLEAGGSIRSVGLLTVNAGMMVERLEQAPEETETVACAHTIARWQLEGTPAFWRWLEHYEVDACSGICSDEQIAQYGFPLPDRPADAVCFMPDALTTQNTPYPIDAIQWEWWLEGEFVLGIKQAGDDVMGCDHFAWYRIPADDVFRREREACLVDS